MVNLRKRKTKCMRLAHARHKWRLFYCLPVVSSFSGNVMLSLLNADGLSNKSRRKLRAGKKVRSQNRKLTVSDMFGPESICWTSWCILPCVDFGVWFWQRVVARPYAVGRRLGFPRHRNVAECAQVIVAVIWPHRASFLRCVEPWVAIMDVFH